MTHTHFTNIHDGFASLILDTIELLHLNITFAVFGESQIRSASDNLCFLISFTNTPKKSSAFHFWHWNQMQDFGKNILLFSEVTFDNYCQWFSCQVISWLIYYHRKMLGLANVINQLCLDLFTKYIIGKTDLVFLHASFLAIDESGKVLDKTSDKWSIILNGILRSTRKAVIKSSVRLVLVLKAPSMAK